MQLKMAYDDHMPESNRTGLHCRDQTKTQQQFKDETNILTIVERFGLTGEMPQVLHLPEYGDFTGIFDFQSAQNTIRFAQEQFMSLPANMRARFHNDPQELLEFVANDDNRAEAEKLGLVEKPRVVVQPQAEGKTPPPDGKTP